MLFPEIPTTNFKANRPIISKNAQPCTHHVQCEWETKEEEPDVEMESIDKCVLMRIIIPSASDGSPDALSQDLEGLGPHFCPYIDLIVSQQHGSRSLRLQLSSFVRVKFYYAGGCWLQLATDSHLVVGHQRQLGGLPAVLQTPLLLSRQSRGRGSVCGKQHSAGCNPMTSGGGGVWVGNPDTERAATQRLTAHSSQPTAPVYPGRHHPTPQRAL